jgi:hypothetical protein
MSVITSVELDIRVVSPLHRLQGVGNEQRLLGGDDPLAVETRVDQVCAVAHMIRIVLGSTGNKDLDRVLDDPHDET